MMQSNRVTQNFQTGTYTIEGTCPSCKRLTRGEVEGYDLFRYNQGAFAQDAFPYLSASVREALFITGICAVCWEKMFADMDED